MNERLRALRKTLELNQADFGARVGVTNPAISKLEKGERNLTDQMILAICREFNVNEEWLRTGDGEMFVERDDTNISAVAYEFELDDLSKTILTTYVNMEATKRVAFNAFVQEMADRVMAQSREKAQNKIEKIISESHASDAIKLDMVGKVASAFVESYPYIGLGNVTESEMSEAISYEQEGSALHAMLDEQLAKEKKQVTKASSVKEFDAG